MAYDVEEPRSLREAIDGPFGGYWSDAARNEFRSLTQFKTWKLERLPQGRKAIASKWVFKVKANANCSIEKFKARLVVKGFSQRPGIDYDETFAPVAHQESIRMLLALAAQHGYKLRHVDIVGAFLNGEMDQQVFMKQPEGFVEPGKADHVCELLKALYGLKQAGMVWNKRFIEFLVDKLGFRRVCADPCIYIVNKDNSSIIMGVHVDDTLMVHNNTTLCDHVVQQLSDEFDITDLGEPTRLLGMRLRRPTETGPIMLDQVAYIIELLKRFNMVDSNPSHVPHQPGVHLSQDMCPTSNHEVEQMKDKPYGELIGGLLWLSINTRPDIVPAVGVLCRYVRNPGPQHWTSAKLVLRYLKGTMQYGIVYSPDQSQPDLTGYVDSDWANDPDTRRSVTGFVLKYANGPIAFKSKGQSSVSTSSVQAEYQALCDAVRETIWLRQLLKEVGHEQNKPTVIHEDNRGCIALTQNNRTDPRTKHIDVKYHYTREQVANKNVVITHIPTADMVADMLTKPVSTAKFQWCRERMGVHDLSKLDWTSVRGGVLSRTG
jgi:hypothetical protein